jgi:hypothetical protein
MEQNVLTKTIRGTVGKHVSAADSASFSILKQEDADMGRKDRNEEQRPAITPGQIKQVQELAQTIRYGSITLVFQDGILVQIDKNEKIRLPKE